MSNSNTQASNWAPNSGEGSRVQSYEQVGDMMKGWKLIGETVEGKCQMGDPLEG